MKTVSSVHRLSGRTGREKLAFARMQEQLEERRSLLAKLEPDAAPHVDAAQWSVVVSIRTTISQIGRALNRIESGTYGLCLTCGETVDPERIRIFPYTENCVPCQRETDKGY